MSAIPAVVALLAFPVTAMVAGASNLLVGYRASDPRDRGRILWLVAGVVTSAWMLLIPFGIFAVADTDRYLLGNLGFALWALAPGVLVSAVSVAMFYGGAVDPRLVLRRSTMLGIAGAVWIAVYAVLENSLAGWLVDSFGIPESIVSAGLALAAAAVALLPKRIGSSVLRNERSRHDEVVS